MKPSASSNDSSNNESHTRSAHHILPTASNLLAICFVILSFVKMGDKSDNTFLDEMIIFPIILFFTASVFSYSAMRAHSGRPKIEKIADMVFMIGLLSLSIIAISLVIEFY